jgi:hypothetical protein
MSQFTSAGSRPSPMRAPRSARPSDFFPWLAGGRASIRFTPPRPPAGTRTRAAGGRVFSSVLVLMAPFFGEPLITADNTSYQGFPCSS